MQAFRETVLILELLLRKLAMLMLVTRSLSHKWVTKIAREARNKNLACSSLAF